LLILYTYVLASFLSASVPKNVPADTLPVHESSLISVSDVIQSVAYSRVFKGNDNQSQERFLAIGILDYVEVQIASFLGTGRNQHFSQHLPVGTFSIRAPPSVLRI